MKYKSVGLLQVLGWKLFGQLKRVAWNSIFESLNGMNLNAIKNNTWKQNKNEYKTTSTEFHHKLSRKRKSLGNKKIANWEILTMKTSLLSDGLQSNSAHSTKDNLPLRDVHDPGKATRLTFSWRNWTVLANKSYHVNFFIEWHDLWEMWKSWSRSLSDFTWWKLNTK